ncbi:uncharacterized protein BDZ99DRAFT_148189 [Mytilinidion resinicola]|uniref:Concanavalin A-like lectin/glucanase n=1 Tax=Mytilinidion resinicola TaxID=574789 RepID=A0A6A6Y717_9PEZI|nr:uncharacterized protein BDZ99DRAFT_148189 [Mytilinidion resinicola]KAF2804602.1 hypothetical protein BDZ99DRAFT_148189 [Mytilinidion resinicola]
MSFTLTAAPDTDIWRKPPAHIAFNAPTHPTTPPTHALSTFKSARLTFSLPPASTLTQYDQAGLLLSLTRTGSTASGPPEKWLKTGVEFYNGSPYVSTVGCDQWADWSVVPLSVVQEAGEGKVEATVEVAREDMGLWVYVVEGSKRVPLREVAWFFAGEEEWEISVAAYAARPGKEQQGGLEAGFKGLEVVAG